MTPERWRLARQVEATVNRDVGRTEPDLARMLGVFVTEVRRVAWALYGARRVDRCWDYVVALPPRRVKSAA